MALKLPSEIINTEYIDEFKNFILKLAFGEDENAGVAGCIFKDLPAENFIKEVLIGIGDGHYSITEDKGSLLSKIEENFDLYSSSSISLVILFTPELTELLKTDDETVIKFNKLEELLNENKYINEANLAYEWFLITIKSFDKLGEKGRENLTSVNVLEMQPIYIQTEPELTEEETEPSEDENFDQIG